MNSDVAEERPRSRETGSRKLSHIFHPSDFTEGDKPAFLHALRLAVGARSQLQLLHVRTKDESITWADFPRITETLKNWRLVGPDATHAEVNELGLDILKVQHTGENVLGHIQRFATAHHPDLIVMATHQRKGIDRLLHSSLAEPIARDTKTMTLFIPRRAKGFVHSETGEVRLKNVLIPVDQAPSPQTAVEAASSLVETLGCKDTHFTFLFVGNDEDMPAINAPSQYSWTSESRAWNGDVVPHILETSKAVKADLIVMATRGHHGFLDALRGSTTERVLRGASAPVLAVSAAHKD